MVRITAETKKETRKRILEAALEEFRSTGFDETTTKDIARKARIASGTLFNYFPTKDAIVMTLVAQSLERAQQDFGRLDHPNGTSVDEVLFSYIAAGLRRMRPYRKFIHPALESALSPLARASAHEEAESVRLRHLETVSRIVIDEGVIDSLSTLALHLYWTLYTGVLAFWSNDKSPKQEGHAGHVGSIVEDVRGMAWHRGPNIRMN